MPKRWVMLTAAAAVLAIAAWLWLRRLGNETGIEDFRENRPAITAAQAGGQNPDGVAAVLVEAWMRGFTTGEYSRATRLREYRVDRIAVLPAGERRWVVSARVSVRPTRWSFDNWLAGSGGTVREGWIRGKFLRFAVTRTDSVFELRELGPGPL